MECVIGYASRTLSKSERNYDTHKLEFLALKWSITERYHEYLYGGHFEVYTDNNPLTYMLPLVTCTKILPFNVPTCRPTSEPTYCPAVGQHVH